jgi:hypothetical protein
MTVHENSRSRPGGADSPLFSLMFSEEMTCCGSKNDFYKKSGGLLYSAKVQNHPCSNEIVRNLRKIQKIPPKAVQQNES